MNPGYSEYFALETEGGRVALMSCKRCGALVLIGDSTFDAAMAHDKWHYGRPSLPEPPAVTLPGGRE